MLFFTHVLVVIGSIMLEKTMKYHIKDASVIL